MSRFRSRRSVVFGGAASPHISDAPCKRTMRAYPGKNLLIVWSVMACFTMLFITTHKGMCKSEALATPFLLKSFAPRSSSIYRYDRSYKQQLSLPHILHQASQSFPVGPDGSELSFSGATEEEMIPAGAEQIKILRGGGNNVSSSGGKDPSTEADNIVQADYVAETNLPTDMGQYRLRAYRVSSKTKYENEHIGKEPCVIYSTDKPPFGVDGKLKEGVPLRIHDQCYTSEVFRSQRCDCKQQLNMSLEYIKEHGGFIIYLQQEGRGIGLANKVAAYALQDVGMDTVDANLHLGFPEDCRQYGVVPTILEDMGINSVQLITNNPRKVERIGVLGVKVTNTIPMVVDKANPYNRKYLETKKERMNHTNFGQMLSLSPPPAAMMPNNMDVVVAITETTVLQVAESEEEETKEAQKRIAPNENTARLDKEADLPS